MMYFEQLSNEIHNLTKDVADHLSIFIHTPDGDIVLNDAKQRKAASVAKLFILTEAFRQAEQGNLDLNEMVNMSNYDIVGGSGVIGYLTDPPALRYRHLLELMIIISDNTASNILLDKVGIENINHFTEQIGCHTSKINRHFMDTKAQAKGNENYTSARDMVRLLNLYMQDNTFITEASRKHILTILCHQQLQDKLPKYVDENDQVVFFHKTGELEGVEHDVAIIKYKNTVVEAAILTADWNNSGSGQSYIAEIGRYLIHYLKNST